MKNMLKNKKGFTLIELIVVMAVICILVLIAAPKFMGHTKEAKFTKLISNTKQLENASERYYMDKNDWPRFSDIPYTSAQITAFAQKVYDTTGKEANLDPLGNYYDVDYSKLSKYIHIPDDKMDYIIQNPVGNVYALENLTNNGEIRLNIQGITLNKNTTNVDVGEFEILTATVTPDNAIDKSIVWSSSNENISKVDISGKITGIASGLATITATTVEGNYQASCEVTVNAPPQPQVFNYLGNYESYSIPKTGKYKLELWGGQGGAGSSGTGGKGGYVYGEKQFIKDELIYVYIGGKGLGAYLNGGWNGGGTSGQGSGSGGGATDIRTVSGNWNNLTSLQSRIIVAAGGGGGGNGGGVGPLNGGSGGGLTGGFYIGSLYSFPTSAGTQISGGSINLWTTYWIVSGTGGNGSLGTGGKGGGFIIQSGSSSGESGSGGGGGYYGGGSGSVAGAGGGSSYYGTLASSGTTAGIQSGNGQAKLTYIGQ